MINLSSSDERRQAIAEFRTEDELNNLYLKIQNEYGFAGGPDMELINLREKQIAELEEFGEIKTNTPDDEAWARDPLSFLDILED